MAKLFDLLREAYPEESKDATFVHNFYKSYGLGICISERDKVLFKIKYNEAYINLKRIIKNRNNQNKQTNMKKFICPYDLFGGKVPKGSIYEPAINDTFGYVFTSLPRENAFYLPKEIVETWEEYKEPQYKEGDWVTNNKNIAFRVTNDNNVGYHINKYYLNNYNGDDIRPATSEEIFAVLKEEAKKRGLVEGAKYIWPDMSNPKIIGDLCLSETGNLCSLWNIIYDNYFDTWATLVPSDITYPVGKRGLNVTISKGKIEYDGHIINDQFLKRIIDVNFLNRINSGFSNIPESPNWYQWKVISVNIGCNEDDIFTTEEIKKVIEDYNKLNN